MNVRQLRSRMQRHIIRAAATTANYGEDISYVKSTIEADRSPSGQKSMLLKSQAPPNSSEGNRQKQTGEQLDLDIDTLLAERISSPPSSANTDFSDADLEKFAELLFDFQRGIEERGERPSGGRNRHSTATSTRRRRPHRSTATTSSRIWTNTSKAIINGTGKTTYMLPKTRLPRLKPGEEYTPSCPPRRRPANGAIRSSDIVMARLLGRGGISRLKVGQVFESVIPIAIIAVGMEQRTG